MKFNNKDRIEYKKDIYKGLFLVMVLAFIIITSTPLLDETYKIVKYGILVCSVLLIYYSFYGYEYFEYDSSGKILIIKNASIIRIILFPERIKAIEFPKGKLNKYKIKNYRVHRSLIIYINSKHSGTVKLKFNITHISSKRAKALKKSLRKIVKENNADL